MTTDRIALAIAVLALGVAIIAVLHTRAATRRPQPTAGQRMATDIARRKRLADEHTIPVNGQRRL